MEKWCERMTIDEKQVDANTVFIGITLNNILEKE